MGALNHLGFDKGQILVQSEHTIDHSNWEEEPEGGVVILEDELASSVLDGRYNKPVSY